MTWKRTVCIICVIIAEFVIIYYINLKQTFSQLMQARDFLSRNSYALFLTHARTHTHKLHTSLTILRFSKHLHDLDFFLFFSFTQLWGPSSFLARSLKKGRARKIKHCLLILDNALGYKKLASEKNTIVNSFHCTCQPKRPYEIFTHNCQIIPRENIYVTKRRNCLKHKTFNLFNLTMHFLRQKLENIF